MSLKKALGRVFLCLTLGTGAVFGVPMIPRQIEELMHALNRTHQEQVIRSEAEDDVKN